MPSTIAEVDALEYRQRYRGLIGVEGKIPARDRHILSLVYTPGGLVGDKALKPESIIPTMMDLRVPLAVAAAVARAAIETGVARNPVDPAVVAENARGYLYEGHRHLLA